MTDEAEVLVSQRGHLGLLTLNRPRALNALTHTMVSIIATALESWRGDDTVQTVAVVGAGERGLCAGGDVVSLHRDVTTSDGSGAAEFWRDEYAMNALIDTYPKPFVAVQDGIVLGGGVGVSAHGSHRVVTERTKIGFPETTIGFIPDVGATWLLSRAPGELGVRLALSSENVGAADAILVGFSDVFVPTDRIGALLEGLETLSADDAIAAVSAEAPAGVLAGQREWTDMVFAAATVPGILAALRAVGVDEASALADGIEAKSPIAVATSLEAVRRARALPDLGAALTQEYRVSRYASLTADFAEGIRAQLIDKDRNPSWTPAQHADVSEADVEAFFQEPAEGDLRITTTSKETS